VLAQQLLRHADVRSTRAYLRPSMERLAEGMRKVEVVRSETADQQGNAR
jgi:hypothetical protein